MKSFFKGLGTVGLVVCVAVSPLAAAGDPASVDTEEPDCTVGTLVFAFGVIPTIAQIATGTGQGVAANGEHGKLTCRGRVEFGTDTIAAIAFLPGPQPNVPVTLMTWDEICFYLPLLVPGQSCHGGRGAVTIRGQDVGIPCLDGYVDADGNPQLRSTLAWREVLSPSGEATITCRFR